jgi:hypothetical protein|tara:strand:+ start:258 stop:593 length:336 start_codon:yes stop_codon:yes gene_type:complete
MAGPTKKQKLSTLKRFKAKQRANYATTARKHEKKLFETLKEAEKLKSPLVKKVRQALTIARMAVSPVEGIMKVNAQTVKNLVEKVKEDKARKDREEKRKSKITKKIVSKRL